MGEKDIQQQVKMICTDHIGLAVSELKILSASAKGDMVKELTCALLGVKNLNKKGDKSPVDHSRHSTFGILQVRGKWYEHIRGYWSFGRFERYWHKIFDNMICYCISRDGKIIERIYIFPKEEIIKRKNIAIIKNPSKGRLWYEKYRIIDEEMIKKANDIWNNIIKKIDKKEM